MTFVVGKILSFAQYNIPHLSENLSRISAVRTDCSGRGANRKGAIDGSSEDSSLNPGTGQGGIGLGSCHLCGDSVNYRIVAKES